MKKISRPKHVFFLNSFQERSACFTDEDTREEDVLSGPTPLRVGTFTSYLLHKVQDPFTPCRQSHGKNICFFNFLYVVSLRLRQRNSGRECAWWTNSLVGQFLQQLSLGQSSRSIQLMETVPWQNHLFLFHLLERTSLCFTDLETREYNVLGGVLTSSISCTKFKIHAVHADSPMAKTCFLLIQVFYEGPACAPQQKETQEENVHAGLTPLWVSSYTSYLLYKAQDPFSTC